MLILRPVLVYDPLLLANLHRQFTLLLFSSASQHLFWLLLIQEWHLLSFLLYILSRLDTLAQFYLDLYLLCLPKLFLAFGLCERLWLALVSLRVPNCFSLQSLLLFLFPEGVLLLLFDCLKLLFLRIRLDSYFLLVNRLKRLLCLLTLAFYLFLQVREAFFLHFCSKSLQVCDV